MTRLLHAVAAVLVAAISAGAVVTHAQRRAEEHLDVARDDL